VTGNVLVDVPEFGCDLLGIRLSSNTRFATPVHPASGSAQREFVWYPQSVHASDVAGARRSDVRAGWAIEPLDAENAYRVDFANNVSFSLDPQRVTCCHPGDRLQEWAEAAFLGPICAFWLEMLGTPCLHAGAVAVGGRAVAFLGGKGAGKTSLVAAMMLRNHSLMTDDLLAVDTVEGGAVAYSSYPQLRMSCEQAAYFRGAYTDLARAQRGSEKRRVAVGRGGFGRSSSESTRLACVYVPQRYEPRNVGDDDVEIAPVTAGEAITELIRHSFTPRMINAVGWQAQRLGRVARVCEAVPIRRITYASGLEKLEAVGEAVEQDIEHAVADGKRQDASL